MSACHKFLNQHLLINYISLLLHLEHALQHVQGILWFSQSYPSWRTHNIYRLSPGLSASDRLPTRAYESITAASLEKIKHKGKSCLASGVDFFYRPHQLQRREPLFTPLPSRTPTDADDYNEGYIRVDSPDAVLGGVLNARPVKIPSALPSLGPAIESPVSMTLSEREHREHAGRLHDVPRLLDRPPPLQRAGSFHGSHGGRVSLDEPVVMSPSPSRSSASGSDHTIEALRTPPSHPSERVIPPLPRNYSGGYVPGLRSPTDIHGNHTYEVLHDAHSHSHHNPEIYLDRYARASGYDKDAPIYYIIPGGMNVIFQDEYGNEITRVGDFSGRSRPSRPDTIVTTEDLIEGIVNLTSSESMLTPLPVSSGVTHPVATALTPRIGGVMIITQIMESITITEKETGVITEITEITGTEVTLTTQTTANTEITEVTGIPTHTEITEVTENMVDIESTETINCKGGRRRTPQAECLLEHRIGHTATRVKCLWRDRLSSTPNTRSSSDRRSERDYAASHASMRHQEDEADINDGLQALHM
ncbi:hypothetical protein J3R82DRAFT_4405 [Butyriboletus roseoflavus]|nr:hypothetical protein J3R82DRAFT_4405 [Butyriboletus roseoflavus]